MLPLKRKSIHFRFLLCQVNIYLIILQITEFARKILEKLHNVYFEILITNSPRKRILSGMGLYLFVQRGGKE